MNRRTLFSGIALLPMLFTGAKTETSIPVFEKSEYVIIAIPFNSGYRETCPKGHLHGYLTKNCHSIAFPRETWAAGGEMVEPLESSIPYSMIGACAVNCTSVDGEHYPHTHSDTFRWV